MCCSTSCSAAGFILELIITPLNAYGDVVFSLMTHKSDGSGGYDRGSDDGEDGFFSFGQRPDPFDKLHPLHR